MIVDPNRVASRGAALLLGLSLLVPAVASSDGPYAAWRPTALAAPGGAGFYGMPMPRFRPLAAPRRPLARPPLSWRHGGRPAPRGDRWGGYRPPHGQGVPPVVSMAVPSSRPYPRLRPLPGRQYGWRPVPPARAVGARSPQPAWYRPVVAYGAVPYRAAAPHPVAGAWRPWGYPRVAGSPRPALAGAYPMPSNARGQLPVGWRPVRAGYRGPGVPLQSRLDRTRFVGGRLLVQGRPASRFRPLARLIPAAGAPVDGGYRPVGRAVPAAHASNTRRAARPGWMSTERIAYVD